MLMLRCDVLPPTLPLLGMASPKTQQYAASLLVALATGEKSARRAMLPLDIFGKVSSSRFLPDASCWSWPLVLRLLESWDSDVGPAHLRGVGYHAIQRLHAKPG